MRAGVSGPVIRLPLRRLSFDFSKHSPVLKYPLLGEAQKKPRESMRKNSLLQGVFGLFCGIRLVHHITRALPQRCPELPFRLAQVPSILGLGEAGPFEGQLFKCPPQLDGLGLDHVALRIELVRTTKKGKKGESDLPFSGPTRDHLQPIRPLIRRPEAFESRRNLVEKDHLSVFMRFSSMRSRPISRTSKRSPGFHPKAFTIWRGNRTKYDPRESRCNRRKFPEPLFVRLFMTLYNSETSYEKSRRGWCICRTHGREFLLLSEETPRAMCNLRSSHLGNFAYDITPWNDVEGLSPVLVTGGL